MEQGQQEFLVASALQKMRKPTSAIDSLKDCRHGDVYFKIKMKPTALAYAGRTAELFK